MNDILNLINNFINDPVVQLSKKQVITWSQILEIFAAIIVAYLVFFIIKNFVNYRVRNKKMRGAQSKILVQLSGYMIFVITLFYIPTIFGYSLSYFFLGSTALLVGLGFGLQQLFLDLLSGVLLLIDKNINLGDVIKLDNVNLPQGKIIHIGLRTTQVQTVDNQIILIPNSKMLSLGINSMMRERGSARFRIAISVAYNSDLDKVMNIVKKILNRDVRIDKDPEVNVILKDFGENGILLEARFWMKELFNSENILSDLRFELLKEFRTGEIEIPFPQRVIHNK